MFCRPQATNAVEDFLSNNKYGVCYDVIIRELENSMNEQKEPFEDFRLNKKIQFENEMKLYDSQK